MKLCCCFCYFQTTGYEGFNEIKLPSMLSSITFRVKWENNINFLLMNFENLRNEIADDDYWFSVSSHYHMQGHKYSDSKYNY